MASWGLVSTVISFSHTGSFAQAALVPHPHLCQRPGSCLAGSGGGGPPGSPPGRSCCSFGWVWSCGGVPVGVVQQWGLFPALNLGTMALLPALGSLMGWGTQQLSPVELASLWDVLILVSDSLSGGSGVAMLCDFCLSAPEKVLFAGADSLLTTLFRGGGTSICDRGCNGVDGTDGTYAGPCPKSNKELGLAAPSVWQDGKEATRLDTPVVKGDFQKADGAAVPDQLWVCAFLQGYEQEHLAVLGLSPACPGGHLRDPAGHLRDGHPPDWGIGWAAALILFRKLGLQRWKRQLVRGYQAWRRKHVKITRGCRLSHMVRLSASGADYVWSTKGRAAYRSQWTFLHSTLEGQSTVRAGLDAIRRGANASWFEWLEGSAPLFWN
jgi:hypothetical protein